MRCSACFGSGTGHFAPPPITTRIFVSFLLRALFITQPRRCARFTFCQLLSPCAPLKHWGGRRPQSCHLQVCAVPPRPDASPYCPLVGRHGSVALSGWCRCSCCGGATPSDCPCAPSLSPASRLPTRAPPPARTPDAVHTVAAQFALIANVSIASLNVSLLVNSVGFYQIAKLLIIPFVCGVEAVWMRRRFTPPVLVAIATVVSGVAIVCVSPRRCHQQQQQQQHLQ
jgi:hypothetical protein